MHSQSVSHQGPPVDVGGRAGQVATVELQRILYTKVPGGQDLVGEVYLGVTEREREREMLVLRRPGGSDSLPGPASGWAGVAHSVTGQTGHCVDEGVIVSGQGGDERRVRQTGCLHHHWTTAALPHHGEGRHTEGVGLAPHQAHHALLQPGAEDLQQQQ